MKYLLIFLFWGSLSQAEAFHSCKPELMAKALSSSEIIQICSQESLTTDHEFLAWWIPENENICRVQADADTHFSYETCLQTKLSFAEEVLSCSQSPKRLKEAVDYDLELEENFIKEYGEVAIPKAIRDVFDKLTKAAEKYYNFEIKVPQWNIRAYGAKFSNASAAADGRVIISQGMWKVAKFSVDEIAAILAHEVSHVIFNHSLKVGCLKYEWIGEGGDMTIKEATLNFHEDLNLSMGRGKNWTEHSKKYEYEADFNAVKLLKLIDKDPGLMVKALIKLRPKGKGGFSTGSHPETNDRIKALGGLVP